MHPITIVTTKHIEQHEKRGLTAIGQGNIFRLQSPAILTIQKLSQGGNELLLTLGRVINTNQPARITITLGHVGQHLLDPSLNLGNMAGIAPTHHDHVVAGRQGVAKVIHQGGDSRIRGKFPTKGREFHDAFLYRIRTDCHPSVGQSQQRCRSVAQRDAQVAHTVVGGIAVDAFNKMAGGRALAFEGQDQVALEYLVFFHQRVLVQ